MAGMDEHAQADVPGMGFEADSGIVNLLAYLNEQGVATLFSCQGDESQAGYMLLDDPGSLPSFLQCAESLIRASGQRELLLALRHDARDFFDLEQEEPPVGGVSRHLFWEIKPSFNLFFAAHAVDDAVRQSVTDDMTPDAEQLHRAGYSAGWKLRVSIPAEHMRVLDDAARQLRH
jgi:hypothetical protein